MNHGGRLNSQSLSILDNDGFCYAMKNESSALTRHWRLLSRPQCGLCREMVESLEELFGVEGYVLAWVDVDTDEALKARWGLLIPVLLDESDNPLSISRLDPDSVSSALGRAPRVR